MDNGGEYIGKLFQEELGKTGTVHLTTAADTPEQNRLAKRMNQTLINTATTMLIESGLPKSFCSDAMLTTATIIGRMLAAGLQGKVPYSVIFNHKVDISWFHPFGSTAYALILKDQQQGKFVDKVQKAILISYMTRKKAYKLIDVKTKKEFSSQHIHFDKNTDLLSEIVDLENKMLRHPSGSGSQTC